jgi:transcriptional regulator with XRE-family HTH domain
MQKDMHHIGKNIRRIRCKQGWNQAEAAKRLRLSTAAFSNIETGITDISISRLYQLADIFQVSVHEILNDCPSAGQVFTTINNSTNLSGQQTIVKTLLSAPIVIKVSVTLTIDPDKLNARQA